MSVTLNTPQCELSLVASTSVYKANLMRAFDVSFNGKKLCLAEAGDRGSFFNSHSQITQRPAVKTSNRVIPTATSEYVVVVESAASERKGPWSSYPETSKEDNAPEQDEGLS